MEEPEPRIESIDFTRLVEGWVHCGDSCQECNNPAEFEYGIYYDRNFEREPDATGALCGACAAVILLQEAANDHVVLEKHGTMVRAVR